MGTVQKLVLDFAEKIHLEPPEFENGIASIRFDDMILNFFADEEHREMALFMDMGLVPKDSAERLALYSRLLKLNNFGRDIGGGVLGVDDKEEVVTFCRFFPVEQVELPQFEQILEAYLNLAESLRRGISGPDTPAEQSDPDAASIPPSGGLRA